jgi:hypothetical protein
MVSPEDYQGIDKLQTRAANPLYTSADELRSRQEAALIGEQSNLPLRRNLLPTIADEAREPIARDFSTSNIIPAPDYEDQLNNEIVDIIPEDLSNEYTGLPSELAVNRDSQTISPIVNTTGPMNDMNYSYDMPGEGENYIDEYEEPYSAKRNEMLESLGRGPSNVPFYPIGEDAPLIGPDAASEYLDESMNYDMNLPYETELPKGRFTQKMVDDSQRRFEKRQAAARRNIEKQKEQVKNQTRREVKQQDNSLTTEPTVTKPVTAKPITREQKKYQQKIITRIQQINELLSEFQPESIKTQLEEERESLSKGDFSKTSSFFRQYGGANYTYPQLPVAQTMGQFNMSTPYANKNTALMPSAESMVTNPFAMDANYQNPLTGASPAIRMGTDGEYVNEGVLTDEDLAKLNQRDMSIDYKVKNMYNIDGPRLNDNINTGVRFGESLINAYRNMGIQDDFNQNLTSDNIDAVKQTLDQGKIDPNSGIRNPNQMGFKGVAQYGGYMKEGGDIYNQDDETWMSEDQVRQFLAEGGELEFIQE